MKNRQERGSLYLLTGFVLGVVLGLWYARYLQPVEYVDITPASLNQQGKNQYRSLIAFAYQANQDLFRAKARLELLEDPEIINALNEQAQRSLAANSDPSEAQALGILAVSLSQPAPIPKPVISTQTPTSTTPE